MVRNPTTMLSMARHALGLRVAVPLDALRWFIANTPPSKKAPQDVTITPRPPAIGIGATVDLMGTTVRAGASIKVDQIEVGDDHGAALGGGCSAYAATECDADARDLALERTEHELAGACDVEPDPARDR